MTDRPDPATQPGPLGRTSPDPGDPGVVGRRTTLVILGLGALVGCLVVLGTLAAEVRSQEAIGLDAAATPFLHSLASPPLDAVMNAATFIGSETVMIPVLAAAVALLFALHQRREALFLLVALSGSLIADGAMKAYFHRPRPALAWAHVLPDFSFPSGHSMNSVVFLVALALIVWRLRGRRAGTVALLVAVAAALVIGTSRIYLGYHYLTDVVAGFTAGIVWLAIVVAAFRGESVWRERRSSTRVAARPRAT